MPCKMKSLLLVLFFTFLLPLSAQILDFKNIEKQISAMEKSFSDLQDYTCMFNKMERIGDRCLKVNEILFKFRKEKELFLTWTTGENKGQKIYFNGSIPNPKILVRPPGLMSFTTLSLDPRGALAMRNNRHSIFESGMGYIIQMIRKNYELSKKLKIGDIFFVKEISRGDHKLKLYRSHFPEGKGFYAGQIDILINSVFELPTELKTWDWNQELVEHYSYINIKLNSGLKDENFTKNL